MVRGVDNTFDYLELCFLSSQQKNYFSEIGSFFQEITFITEFPGSNYILNRWQMGLSGGKFATCTLLLLISNPGIQNYHKKTSAACSVSPVITLSQSRG